MEHFNQLTMDKQELLKKYLNLLIQTNEKINLTSIEDESSGLVLHIEDSLTALPYFIQAPDGLYMDMGSGGGVPGIPLAIASGRKTILVDSSKKKMNVVQDIVCELGLDDQITTCSERMEDLAKRKPRSAAIITARAVSKLSAILELASPLIIDNGIFIAMKSKPDSAEMDAASKVAEIVGFTCMYDQAFVLEEQFTRRILVYRKVRPSKVKLPRRNGLAQHTPVA